MVMKWSGKSLPLLIFVAHFHQQRVSFVSMKIRSNHKSIKDVLYYCCIILKCLKSSYINKVIAIWSLNRHDIKEFEQSKPLIFQYKVCQRNALKPHLPQPLRAGIVQSFLLRKLRQLLKRRKMIGGNDSYTNKGRHETATTESALPGIAPPPPSAGARVYLCICFCE